MSTKEKFIALIHSLQNTICQALEKCDGKAFFKTDEWNRPEGGGGITKVIGEGNVFEKGGVNTSVVYGDVTVNMRKQLNIEGHTWFACGISSVIHPSNPFVPTVHFNYRYLIVGAAYFLPQILKAGLSLICYRYSRRYNHFVL